MRAETTQLAGATPGASYALTVLHFGDEGADRKAYVQGGLHADEAPGMLCAHHLRARLAALETDGRIRGHIVLVPAANPLGLSQFLFGSHEGRFALGDGANFNRGYPDVTEEAARIVAGRLTGDPARNRRLVKAALTAALAPEQPRRAADDLKRILLSHALGADTVLDLHCDGEALNHLYVLAGQEQAFAQFAARLGCAAVLFSSESGGGPFDEAVSRPWGALARRFPEAEFGEPAVACTVELRGRGDVGHELAAADAEAVLAFLAERGHLDADAGPAPPPSCAATPLEACEALEAPCAGLIVYRQPLGARVEESQVVAEIVDPASGEAHAVHARASGVFFARPAGRVAHAGMRLGKIAGSVPFRSGPLLSP